MSKRILALIGALAMAMFSGCGQKLEPDQILSVRFRNNGKIITVGDSVEHVNKVTGGIEGNVHYTEYDQVYLKDYENAEGVLVGLFEDKVVTLRLISNNNWEVSTGLRIGMTKSEAWDIYRDYQYVEQGLKGGILISYDKDLNPIPFDHDSYYFFQVTFDEEDKVDYIGIHTQIAEMTLRERGEFYGDDDADDDQDEGIEFDEELYQQLLEEEEAQQEQQA